jgi:hypothetical protein|tara:strand:+ start:6763 stop:7074 length:312 start_codon:yes stop_codon:yes gene_type:complete
MRRKKLQSELSDLQLDIVGIPLYVDVEEFVNFVTTKDTEDDDEILHINAPKYEILRLMLEVVLNDNEIVDDSLGIRALRNSTIPFKLTLNTLINYNIIKEIKN